MTIESRIVFDLAEIKAVIFVCETCGARVALTPRSIDFKPPEYCPSGHHWNWNIDTGYTSTASPFRALLSALARLQDPLLSKVGFRVLLEINGPAVRASSDKD